MSDSMQRKLPFLSTPRYTQSNVSPHNFDHFCTRQEALDVPQSLIFTNLLVKIWSDRVDLVCVKPPLSNMFTLPLCSSFTKRSADALGLKPSHPAPGRKRKVASVSKF